MTNPVDYFEIGSTDPEASKAFYGGLFSWEMGPPSGAGYSMVDADKGGLWDTSGIGDGNWAIFYVHVADVKDAIEKAVSLGASVAIPLVDNGDIEFAHLLDPQGNRFAVWHPKQA